MQPTGGILPFYKDPTAVVGVLYNQVLRAIVAWRPIKQIGLRLVPENTSYAVVLERVRPSGGEGKRALLVEAIGCCSFS